MMVNIKVALEVDADLEIGYDEANDLSHIKEAGEIAVRNALAQGEENGFNHPLAYLMTISVANVKYV